MKLNEIITDRKEQVIQWFIDNNVIVNSKLLTSDFLDNRKFAERDSFLRCIDQMDELTGVIDFPDCILKFEIKLKSPPPFKFGNVSALKFYRLSDIQMFDFSELRPRCIFDFVVNDPKIDMNEVANAFETVKASQFLAIRINSETQMKATTNLTAGIQKFWHNAAIKEIMIIFKDKAKRVLLININSKESTITAKTGYGNAYKEHTFSNIMDLQEWMFDNGFEHIL